MIERVELFRGRDFFIFLVAFCAIFIVSISINYYNYLQFSSTKTKTLVCKIQNQYTKTKYNDVYYILKLKSKNGVVFYTSKGLYVGKIIGDIATFKIYLNHLTFLDYLGGFYAKSKILNITDDNGFKQKLNYLIAMQHPDKNMAIMYKALYTAAPQSRKLRQKLSALGISHLLAISGFHLGVLSAILFFLIGLLYKPLHNIFFPYRHVNRDIFIIVALCLLWYVWFLDFTPSLIRSFAMLVIGYFLYDRGIKVISMQTLLLTILLLISFYPRLLVSLGFWLSVSGVFYIFLFLQYFKYLKKYYIFILLPIFVYLMMLPYSLYLFHVFSIYNPLSIVWTELFTLFYPLSIVAHLLKNGDIFDNLLTRLLALGDNFTLISISTSIFTLHVILSLLAIRFRIFFYFLNIFAISFFIYAIYYVA